MAMFNKQEQSMEPAMQLAKNLRQCRLAANEREGGGMSKFRVPVWRWAMGLMISVVSFGLNTTANAGWFGLGGDSWKEEVLLHDGKKLIVKRTVERGGRHEIGQSPPIKEQSFAFSVPDTNERITWTIKISEDTGLADLKPILLDMVGRETYLVSVPVGCLAYNKWTRPNPPYVVFKLDARTWNRIPVADLPTQITTPNMIISSPDDKAANVGESVISAETIRKINSGLTQPEYKTILREALPFDKCPKYSSGPTPPIQINPRGQSK